MRRPSRTTSRNPSCPYQMGRPSPTCSASPVPPSPPTLVRIDQQRSTSRSRSPALVRIGSTSSSPSSVPPRNANEPSPKRGEGDRGVRSRRAFAAHSDLSATLRRCATWPTYRSRRAPHGAPSSVASPRMAPGHLSRAFITDRGRCRCNDLPSWRAELRGRLRNELAARVSLSGVSTCAAASSATLVGCSRIVAASLRALQRSPPTTCTSCTASPSARRWGYSRSRRFRRAFRFLRKPFGSARHPICSETS